MAGVAEMGSSKSFTCNSSHSAPAMEEAMKRLKIEPELRDRGKRQKGLSFGTIFKLLASILAWNGS